MNSVVLPLTEVAVPALVVIGIIGAAVRYHLTNYAQHKTEVFNRLNALEKGAVTRAELESTMRRVESRLDTLVNHLLKGGKE